ncbi:MAG: thioredoxin [Desulfococcaceae bacterium]
MSGDFILRCPSCGTRNRIPAERVGQTAKCGKCKAAISTDSLNIDRPVTVTDATFQQEVIQSPLPVLLDCWAPWCGPCQMMEPYINELAREWKGKARVAKLNVDENQVASTRFQISTVPTLMVFNGGKVMKTLPGAVPRHVLARAMAPFIK